MIGNRTCYVCCVYLGDRRCAVKQYDEDRLSYVKEHVKSLQETLHNLARIVFVFNLEEEHHGLYEQAKSLIPRRIQGAEVELIERENIGMSYGAWSDAYEKYQGEYDYYIFNEDDYFFVEDHFDRYLVDKFNSFQNIGYLCGMAMNPSPGVPWVTHAGNSIGISSSKVLKKVHEKFGCLPHQRQPHQDLEERYGINEQKGQVAQTHEIFKMGYNIYDIREDYCVPHDTGPYLKWKFPEYDHFIDNYFHWNNRNLFIPAPLRFNHSVFFINIMDQQYQRKRSCLAVNFYFGERRRTIEEYVIDRLTFLRKQVETLEHYHHNLDKIVFNFNVEPEHYEYVNEAMKIVPKKLQNTPVEVHLRKNVGLSYGAFSDTFYRLRSEYDYFIFNEDDYFLVENNWDEYLIRKYNSLPNTGYLCAIQRDEAPWKGDRIHAGHSFGIASTSSLNAVWDLYNCLPHFDGSNDYDSQEEAQREFGYSFVKAGLRVYDIREDYRVAIARTEEGTEDVWRWFWWNEKDLVVPAILAYGKYHTWYESFDGPCVRRTNLEKYEN